MKKIDPDEINLMTLAIQYSNESKARALFESWRWPNGKPICPHCQHDEAYRIESKASTKKANKARAGLYCCAACRKTFSATVGTVLEDSHIPLSKWVMAMFIMCSSKKAVSALQLSRMLKLTYKTAWFMAHRIRFAMGTDLGKAKPLSNTVEADETFFPDRNAKKSLMIDRQATLAAIIERDGEARTRVIPTVTAKNVGQFLYDCVSKEATLNTDEHGAYRKPGKAFARHDSVVHSRKQYARHNPDGTVSHVNTCESFFSLLKRGVFGAWHCISKEHLPKYASEFEYRWNTRKQTDGERTANFIPMISGKRLMYRRPVN